MFCKYCGQQITDGVNFCNLCGNAQILVEEQKPKHKGHWGLWTLLGIALVGAVTLAISFSLNNRHSEPASLTDAPESRNLDPPPGCLELSNPSADCLVRLQRLGGFSNGFVRSGWTAFHYANVWWPAAHGRGGEKFDRSVYDSRVVPSLKATRNQARNSKEKTFLQHESAALELFRVYDAYSQLRDSEIDPKKVQAFRVLTGGTPEQFAKASLKGADQCMMAVLSDLGSERLSGEWVNAARDCASNHGRLHGSLKNP